MGLLNKILKTDNAEEKKADVDSVDKVKVEKKDKPVVSSEKKVAVKKTVSKSDKKAARRDDEKAYKVISHPLITEKATDLAQINKYVFAVPINVNKNEISKTIANIYGVKPLRVNVILKRGKKVRYGRRFGKTKDFKKAIVTLSPEDRIEVYEGV
jgi:large subunit ribosomal protein L23